MIMCRFRKNYRRSCWVSSMVRNWTLWWNGN